MLSLGHFIAKVDGTQELTIVSSTGLQEDSDESTAMELQLDVNPDEPQASGTHSFLPTLQQVLVSVDEASLTWHVAPWHFLSLAPSS